MRPPGGPGDPGGPGMGVPGMGEPGMALSPMGGGMGGIGGGIGGRPVIKAFEQFMRETGLSLTEMLGEIDYWAREAWFRKLVSGPVIWQSLPLILGSFKGSGQEGEDWRSLLQLARYRFLLKRRVFILNRDFYIVGFHDH